ncbi:MAG: biotin/lipoyl-binding protein [Planctomycetota bacterium]
MSTLAQSLVSSSSRTLPIRVRPDLRARRQRYQGRTYWVIKDPVALQYFRFEEEEFAILQMLDGESSLDEIAEQFERDFPPQTIRTEELQQFIGMLHRSGLVIADAGGQGDQLKKRRDERTKKELLGKFTNILSVRFKGFDPERLLNLLYAFPPVRWFFSTTALVLCSALVLSAATLVLVNFGTFQSRLPSFNAFFATNGTGSEQWLTWLLLGVVLSGTKILHEFGHGLSCKHFGGECHEMGVMFLVLTPCLYCNVSDSWMLPSRWKRAAIGAAGMYVEVVLASICTFIWWFTPPDTIINNVCLNVMLISSVSTILFNANPLLRYDGYYILSDLLEIPNLRQKASSILNRKLGKWCLGLDPPEDPFLPKRNQGWFALYAIASPIYRWVVVLSIVWFLNQVLEPYGLKRLGQLIALSAIWGLVGMPLWKFYKFLTVPGRMHKVKRLRMYATIAIVIALLVGVAQVPLPTTVQGPVVIQALDAQTVYVTAPGVLKEVLVKPGEQVEAGQVLARLVSIDADLQIARLESQISEYEAQLEDLNQLSLTIAGADDQRAQVEELLQAAEEQLAKQQADTDRLILRAPIDGVVIPPTYFQPRKGDDRELDSWKGTPLDKKNLNATLEPPLPFCQIGPANKFEAQLAIEQSQITVELDGLPVEIMLDQTPDFIYSGKLEKRSDQTMKTTPPRLSSLNGGEIPTEMDETGVARPVVPHIDATVPLVPPKTMSPEAQEAHDLLRVGLTGRAKIDVPDLTLWKRLQRYLSKTFLEI